MVACVDALEVTIGSDSRFSIPQNAALVSLCRLLAWQIDDAGDGASSRITAAYLSALKDLAKVTTTGAAVPTTGSGGGSIGALGKLQSIKGGKSA